MKKLIYFISFISLAFILSGCGPKEKVYYLHPTYQTIKTVDKVKSPHKIKVQEDGTMDAQNTVYIFALIKSLRIKENYMDAVAIDWNRFAKRKNQEAEKHNEKIRKKILDTEKDTGIHFEDFMKIFESDEGNTTAEI